MDNLREVALDILEAACETDEIREDEEMDLFEAGFMDSLVMVSIIIEIEQKLNIKLQPTDLKKENVVSVNKFEEFLKEKVN